MSKIIESEKLEEIVRRPFICDRDIIHTQVKTIVDSPLCICGIIEMSEDFFFECNNYDSTRTRLFNALSSFGNIDL